MHHHDGLDPVFAILVENRLHVVLLGAVTPVARDKMNIQAEIDRHLFPQCRELPSLEHKNLVAG